MRADPMQLLRPYRAAMGRVLALVGISALAEAAGLVLLSALLSAVVPGPIPSGDGVLRDLHRFAHDAPGLFLVLLGAIYISKTVIALWTTYTSFSLGLRMANDWTLRLLRGYLRTPLQRLTRQQGSMFHVVIGETSLVGGGLATAGLLAQNALSAASVYGALLILSPLLTLGLTVMAGVAAAAVLLLSRYAQAVAILRLRVTDEAYTYVTETLSAIKQLRLFDLEAQAESRAEDHVRRLRRVQRTSAVVASSPRLIIEIVFLVGLAVLLGVLLPYMGGAALADVGLVVAAAFRLLPSLSASAGTWVQLQQAWPGLHRIAAELALLESRGEGEGEGAGLPATFIDRLAVHDVHFAYDGREQALTGIDLEIPRGSFIGIVGPSGSGKSTLVDLLCGFYAPDSGRILVDATDLREIDRAAWRRKLGVVAQDNFLFSGTVRDNLLLLHPTSDDEALKRVVALVGADDLIAGLPRGYDTPVGERGLRLSGGQRQRLALARVLLRGPEVLILDEATSALDVESEERLQLGLRQLRGTMTMIVIAHRLTSVRWADRIFVISRGRVVEYGSHDELLRHDGAYAAMWRAFGLGIDLGARDHNLVPTSTEALPQADLR